MKSINVYDTEADKLEIIAEKNDISVAEIVEMLMEHIEEVIEEEFLEA